MTQTSVVTYKLKRSKKPGLYLSALCFLFIAAVSTRFAFWQEFGEGKFFFFLLSIVLIILFFFTVIGIIKLTRDDFIGMVISKEGLNDISTGHTYGLVQWKDVTAVKVMDDLEFIKRQYIVLILDNPQAYIDREANQTKKRSLVLKFHFYGSPVCFSNRALNCTFEDLLKTVNSYYDEYKANL